MSIVPGGSLDPQFSYQDREPSNVPALPTVAAYVDERVSASVGSVLGSTISAAVAAAQGDQFAPKNFTQAGTGAAARAVTTKLGEVALSVKDFGATGAGIAVNQTTAVNDAANAAHNAGGGNVDFPVGGYLANPSNTHTDVTYTFGPGAVIRGFLPQILDLSVTGTVGRGIAARLDGTVQHALHISANVAGATNSASSYERTGIYVRSQTSDPSTSSILRDLVGIESLAFIASSNAEGRAWAYHGTAEVKSGGDGYAVGAEIGVKNFGTGSNEYGSKFAKIGLHLIASGTAPGTASVATVQAQTGSWMDGWMVLRGAVTRYAFHLKDGSSTVAYIDRDGDARLTDLTIKPSASVTPANNGEVVFELTSNTTLTIRAKGSDGTVRSAAITLA
jgi:hypothetical protein